jgi:hypothetical protein
MGHWAEAKLEDGEPSSSKDKSSTTGGGGKDSNVMVTRTLRLRMPLDPAPFMPKETAVEKVQRFTAYAGHVALLDTSARSFDVPYGDYFVVRVTSPPCASISFYFQMTSTFAD